jgi:hydroxysqualene dehydroxylase
LKRIVTDELLKQFFILKSDIHSIKIIKEKRATFLPDNHSLSTRPGTITEYNNLLLAGDWTSTGLPSTIEGAILSGKKAADMI